MKALVKQIHEWVKFCIILIVMLTMSFAQVSAVYANPQNTNTEEYKASTEKAHYSDSDYEEAGSDGWMDWLILIATSVVAARLMVNCNPKPADVMIAAAAGLIEIVGEVMEFTKNSDEFESLDMDYDVGQLSESQREALIKQRQSFESMKSALESKATFQRAAAAAYLAAAALVLGLWIAYKTMDTNCKIMELNATNTDYATCIAPCTGPHAGACIAACNSIRAACNGSLAAGNAQQAASEAQDAVPAPSIAKTEQKVQSNVTAHTTKKGGCSAMPQTTSVITGCEGTLGSMIQTMYAACNPSMGIVKNDPLNSLKPAEMLAYSEKWQAKQKMILESTIVAKYFLEGQNFFKRYGEQFNIVPQVGIERVRDSFSKNTLELYIAQQEEIKLLNNEYHSLTIDEYRQLQAINDFIPEKKQRDFFRGVMLAGVNLVIPSAEATDWVKALKIVGPLAAIYFLQQTTIGSFVDEYIASPMIRGVMWAGLAMYTNAAADTAESQAAEIDGRIATIDAILNQYNNFVPETTLAEDQEGPNSTETESELQDLAERDNGLADVARPTLTDQICVEGDKSGNCANMTAENEKASSKFDNLKTIPRNKSLTQARTSAAKLADKIAKESASGKISEGTLADAKALAQQAAGLEKLVKQRQDKINDLLKKEGKKPVDFDEMNKKFKKDITNAAMKPLQQKGISAKQLMNGLFPGKIGMAPKKEKKEKDKNMSVKGPTGSMFGKKKSNVKMFNINQNNDQLETLKPETMVDNNLTDSAEELSKLNYDLNDINNRQDVSIFEILTARYFASAYPKFFKKKKKAEQTQTPPK